MDMASPNSALANTVSPMRRLGLIDEDGVLTDRGKKWRVDSSFADACQEILEEIYPEELGALTGDDGSPDTVSPMRRLGLIDEDGVLTDRGKKWRVDSSFADACQEILEEIYPEELGALTGDDGSPDAAQVKTWFSLQGFGDANARQMAATYVMVARKQLPESPGADSAKAKPKAPRAKKPAEKSPEQTATEKPLDVVVNEPAAPPAKADGGPTVHLDIQIHIPADATPDQIDQIFSSMARHLYAK